MHSLNLRQLEGETGVVVKGEELKWIFGEFKIQQMNFTFQNKGYRYARIIYIHNITSILLSLVLGV